MSQAHDYLRGVLVESSAGTTAYPWHRIELAMSQVMQDRSPDSEDVLTRAALYQGHLTLQPGGHLPHALSPEDHLRLLAVQTLARWDREKHRDTITRAGGLADSDVVADAARSVLA